jgi:NitT/TauT family transport system permease protein
MLGMPEYILPNFMQVVREAVVMWNNAQLLQHFGITAMEVVFGFLFGALLGLAVGVALGLSPRAEAMLSLTSWRCRSRPRWPLHPCS